MRRSPASIFQTNEFERPSFAASSRCVRAAASLASTIAIITARCRALRKFFFTRVPPIQRQAANH